MKSFHHTQFGVMIIFINITQSRANDEKEENISFVSTSWGLVLTIHQSQCHDLQTKRVGWGANWGRENINFPFLSLADMINKLKSFSLYK
jgi:hypothetical protein